jgi:hypothetical protein
MMPPAKTNSQAIKTSEAQIFSFAPSSSLLRPLFSSKVHLSGVAAEFNR